MIALSIENSSAMRFLQKGKEMIKAREKSLKGYAFIDLFAGISGFRIALESLGAKCVYSNEWDK